MPCSTSLRPPGRCALAMERSNCSTARLSGHSWKATDRPSRDGGTYSKNRLAPDAPSPCRTWPAQRRVSAVADLCPCRRDVAAALDRVTGAGLEHHGVRRDAARRQPLAQSEGRGLADERGGHVGEDPRKMLDIGGRVHAHEKQVLALRQHVG